MVGHPCGIRHHKTLPGNKPQLTKSKTFIVRFVWSILDSKPGGKLGGCLAEVLSASLCSCICQYLPTFILVQQGCPCHKAYPGLPHLHAADFASTKADGQIDHLRLRWKWWCGVGTFSTIKIRAGGIAPIIEKKQKGERCQKESMLNQISRLRWQLFPSSVQSCSHDLGFTNSCLEYF